MSYSDSIIDEDVELNKVNLKENGKVLKTLDIKLTNDLKNYSLNGISWDFMGINGKF